MEDNENEARSKILKAMIDEFYDDPRIDKILSEAYRDQIIYGSCNHEKVKQELMEVLESWEK